MPVLSPLPFVLGHRTGPFGTVPKPWVLEPQDQRDQGLVEGTAGLVLAGAPSSGVIHAVAPSVYRKVVTGRHDLSQRVLPWGV